MAEEQTTQTEKLTEEATLLKKYQELKETTVSKEKYEADLKAEKDRAALYLKAITEGERLAQPSENSDSLEKTIANLSKFKGTNLDYWTKMCPAIDATLKKLPKKDIVKAIGSDGLDELIKVNEGMKDMVDKAKGDPDYFRAIYRDRVKDSAPAISSEIEEAGSLVNYFQNKQK